MNYSEASQNLHSLTEKRFEAEIAELIRTGKMPNLAQVQAAIESTRQEFLPLILAARRDSGSKFLTPGKSN